LMTAPLDREEGRAQGRSSGGPDVAAWMEREGLGEARVGGA
jgi:hypothetical protein